MRDLLIILSRWTGWGRTEVRSLGLSEAAHTLDRLKEARRS